MAKSIGAIAKSLSPSKWFSGTHLFGKQVGAEVELEPGELVEYGMIISTDAELAASKSVSFKDVFNNWTRIALQGHNKNAEPAELDTWTYDEANSKVVCTVNSVSTVGFISPGRYDNYVFEVSVSSADLDDDGIGLCLAYIENSDGTVDTLMLYRQGGSHVQPGLDVTVDGTRRPPFALVYNPDAAGVAGTPDTKVVSQLPAPNLKFPDDSPMPAIITTNGMNGGWNILGEIRIRVERTGNVLKMMTSDKGTTTYMAANTMTVDLNSADYLKKFLSPCSVGFIAYSQPGATFKSLTQPGLTDPILDARDNSVWRFDGANWNKTAFDPTVVKEGRIVKNPATGGLYYVQRGYQLIRLN